MADFELSARKLIDWAREDALPYWADKARDPDGGFYEKLTLNGLPFRDCPRRVRVQARTSYSYAYAAYLDLFPGARSASDHAWAYVTAKGMQGSENFTGASIAHLVNDDGSVNDAYRDTYAQAFLILASAWRYRAFGDDEALQVLEQATDFLQTLRSPAGGYLEGAPSSPLPRRQNPHMHLFEAFMAAYESTQAERYLSLATELYRLFQEAFFDERNGVLLEFFTDDWQPATGSGDLVEPGHMMEWVWLLRWYEKLTGENVNDYCNTLYDNTIRMGMNEKTGLLFDEMRLDGTVTKPTSRSWSLTEYIKASIAQSAVNIAGMDETAGRMINKLLETYLAPPERGGWYDQYDSLGTVTSEYMETSTFYHLICAAGEAKALIRSS